MENYKDLVNHHRSAIGDESFRGINWERRRRNEIIDRDYLGSNRWELNCNQSKGRIIEQRKGYPFRVREQRGAWSLNSPQPYCPFIVIEAIIIGGKRRRVKLIVWGCWSFTVWQYGKESGGAFAE